MTSPYGCRGLNSVRRLHRIVTTVWPRAVSSLPNSSSRRDFPMPGPPATSASLPLPPSTAAQCSSSHAHASVRGTKVVSGRASSRCRAELRRTTRRVGTGSAMPFSVSFADGLQLEITGYQLGRVAADEDLARLPGRLESSRQIRYLTPHVRQTFQASGRHCGHQHHAGVDARPCLELRDAESRRKLTPQ